MFSWRIGAVRYGREREDEEEGREEKKREGERRKKKGDKEGVKWRIRSRGNCMEGETVPIFSSKKAFLSFWNEEDCVE